MCVSTIKKNLQSTKAFIDTLENNIVSINVAGEDVPYCTLHLENKQLKLSYYSTKSININNLNNQYGCTVGDTEFLFTPNSYSIKNKIDNTNKKFENSVELGISSLNNKEWNKEETYYYRFVIPIKSRWCHHEIRTLAYEDGKSTISGLLRVKIQDVPIDIFPFENNNQHYMAVETLTKQKQDSVFNITYAISLTLGLITQNAYFDFAYIIASPDKEFQDSIIGSFQELRPSIECSNYIYTRNMYALASKLQSRDSQSVLSQIEVDGRLNANYVKELSIEDFQKLSNIIYDNEFFARATVLLLESSNLSLDMMGAVLSTALETLSKGICDTVSNDNKIFDKGTWSEFCTLYDGFIKSLPDDFSKEQKDHLTSKRNSLQNISNKSKLSIPFEKLGYTLDEREKRVIASRNEFLHGNIKNNKEENCIEHLMYKCYELHKLCSILIFKYAGVSTYIVNNAVLQGLSQAKDEQLLQKA